MLAGAVRTAAVVVVVVVVMCVWQLLLLFLFVLFEVQPEGRVLRAGVEPVVPLVGEVPDREQPQQVPEQIHAQHVQQKMVPPALLKVGQDVLQRALQHLKAYTHHHAQDPVAQDERVREVAQQVRQHEGVQDGVPQHVPLARWVAGVV